MLVRQHWVVKVTKMQLIIPTHQKALSKLLPPQKETENPELKQRRTLMRQHWVVKITKKGLMITTLQNNLPQIMTPKMWTKMNMQTHPHNGWMPLHL